MKTFFVRMRREGLVLAGVATLSLLAPGLATGADQPNFSKETAACLGCHDQKGMEKTLENRETLSLYISARNYAASMHGHSDCQDCHSGIDAKSHGSTTAVIKSRRDYSLSKQTVCRDCHQKNYAAYEDGLHSKLVRGGRIDAPLCFDCHNPHIVKSVKAAAPIAETSCASCHDNIFQAYAADVHGQERVAKGKAAPICADCHRAHDIKAASFGDGIKDSCLGCHKAAVAQHQDWLPNAALHFQAISCPVCHAPNAERRVNLRLYDNVAKVQVSEKSGVPFFKKRAEAADERNLGLDERALWSLLQEFNQGDAKGNTVLRGRLEVRSGVEAHQLSDKSKAIKDCNLCHQAGAQPFQSVSLTVASPDGQPIRHGVQTAVLTSLTATESVRGFYAIGSTRIKLLDYLLVLVLAIAIGLPLLHMTIKWMFRNVREQEEALRIAARAQSDGQALPSDRHGDNDPAK